jgi:hypothetical protein
MFQCIVLGFLSIRNFLIEKMAEMVETALVLVWNCFSSSITV